MVSHVRARLVNGLCHGLADGNGLRLSEGLIDGETCPREVGHITSGTTIRLVSIR